MFKKFILFCLLSICLFGEVNAQAPISRTYIAYSGTYNSATTYGVGDLVTVGTTYYLSIARNNVSNAPAASPSYWQIWTGSGGGVSTIGVTNANGITGTSSGGSNPSLTLSLGAIIPTSVSTGAITATSIVNTGGYTQSGNVANSFTGALATNSINLNAIATARSGAGNSYGSYNLTLNGSYWNGSSAVVDPWYIGSYIGVLNGGNGAPVSYLNLGYNGSLTSSNTVVVPNLTIGSLSLNGSSYYGLPICYGPVASGNNSGGSGGSSFVGLTQSNCKTLLSGEGIFNPASGATSITLNPQVGLNTINLSNNISFVLQGPLQSGQRSCLLFIQPPSGATFTVTPPSNVVGFTPISTVNNKKTEQCFTYSNYESLWTAENGSY